ncbi:MAG: hypothetical protein GX941_09875 [Candidatus Methanofastidiosa archaeon]|nr:hypothetical protein [Candidatus Methanofastidiosa archaeon]
MNEGFYLSAYICIDELQNILDIKLRHDQTVALWEYRDQTLNLIRYWELERISGIKQHAKALFNKKAFDDLLNFLLKDEDLTIDDIICVWGNKDLENDCNYRRQFDSKFAFHSIAHLLTAIYFDNSNPFDDCILGMALDAGPDSMFEEDAYEKYYYSACVIKDGNFDIFPVESPARLWSCAYKKFGIREGTLMALSNAMDTRCFVPESIMDKWRSYEFFNEEARHNAQELVDSICDFVFQLNGSEISKEKCSDFDLRFSKEENLLSMVMKIISQLSLDIVYRNIDIIMKKYHLHGTETIFALAGGFALNCPTNIAVLEKYKFRSYQIPPCASDTGIAMGIGIAAFFSLLKEKKIQLDINSAFYGQDVGNVQQAVKKFSSYIQEARFADMNEFSDLLISGEILIWINDKAEIGPRALGNRSLISDARSTASKDRLNIIKKRQWWRPVAPLVIDEYGEDYFVNYFTSPNMLLNLTVKDDKKEQIAAVIHYDGSARVQSVSEKDNDVLYMLLKNYFNKTGIPVLCNTSLNDAGEPIINRIEEAIEFALHKGLTFICVNGNYLIRLKKSNEEIGKPPSLRNQKFFITPKDFNATEYLSKTNTHKLSTEELTFYFDNPNNFKNLPLHSEKCAYKVRMCTEEYLKKYTSGLDR